MNTPFYKFIEVWSYEWTQKKLINYPRPQNSDPRIHKMQQRLQVEEKTPQIGDRKKADYHSACPIRCGNIVVVKKKKQQIYMRIY